NNTPRSFGKLPYEAALAALRITIRLELKERAPEIWPRHSFLSNSFVPFVSDLDLTFWFATKPDQGLFQRALRIFNRTKRVFPILGEINFYVASEAPNLFELANLYEIRRDPILWTRLGFDDRKADLNERIVFWLRCLDSDRKGLSSIPHFRQKKWAHYAELAQIPLSPELSFTSALKDGIATLVEFSDSERQTMLQNLLAHFSRNPSDEEDVPTTYCRDRWTFFPHRYCLGNTPLPILEEKRARIAYRQIAWEVWALWSQFRNLAEGAYEKDLANYILKLRTFVDQVISPKLPSESKVLLNSLGLLEASLKTWRSSRAIL
ncbi:MAG: hypothetical protein K2X47_05765, partial [Bdellovibrionales bacterium]|nr:hypothetical protein [Bdellovibrionales bacterium]